MRPGRGPYHAGLAGNPKTVADDKTVRALLARLVEKYQTHAKNRLRFRQLPPKSYISGMIGALSPSKMEIVQLEGNFNLGQERSQADREGFSVISVR